MRGCHNGRSSEDVVDSDDIREVVAIANKEGNLRFVILEQEVGERVF